MFENVIVFPIGSYEYHGALLPAETDALIAEKVSAGLSKNIKDSRILPVFNYGISTEHSDFDATITVKSETYFRFMMELLESISSENTLIVIVNGHGGNVSILNAIESEYNYLHQTSKVFCPPIYGRPTQDMSERLLGEFDTHAGSTEASLVAYYNDLKKYEQTNTHFIKKMSGSLRFFRTGEVNPDGVIKDTEKLIMDPDIGGQLHTQMVDTLTNEVQGVIKNLNRINNNA